MQNNNVLAIFGLLCSNMFRLLVLEFAFVFVFVFNFVFIASACMHSAMLF